MHADRLELANRRRDAKEHHCSWASTASLTSGVSKLWGNGHDGFENIARLSTPALMHPKPG